MKISIIISILSAFSVAYILAYIIGDMGYRSSEVIRCTKERKIVFKRPYWPIISKYDITTGLEIYVGGLLKSGNLSISGNPFRYAKEKIFSAGAQTIEISRSLLGEWYDDSLIINIKPDDRAFCALRVVYKFKGIQRGQITSAQNEKIYHWLKNANDKFSDHADVRIYINSIRYDMSQFYPLKAVFEFVLGNRTYRKLKENATLSDWKNETNKPLNDIELSISETVKIADTEFYQEVKQFLELGHKHI